MISPSTSGASASLASGCGTVSEHLQSGAAGLPLELGGGSVGDRAAVIDDDDPVGELVGLVEVLRGQQQGHAVGDQLADDVPHADAARRVQAGRRLVEEQHRRAHHEARRQVEPAAHPAAIGASHAVGGVGEVEAVEQLGRPRPRLAAGQAAQPADHHEVLAPGQHLVDGRRLRGDADVALDLRRLGDDVEPGDPRPAQRPGAPAS